MRNLLLICAAGFGTAMAQDQQTANFDGKTSKVSSGLTWRNWRCHSRLIFQNGIIMICTWKDYIYKLNRQFQTQTIHLNYTITDRLNLRHVLRNWKWNCIGNRLAESIIRYVLMLKIGYQITFLLQQQKEISCISYEVNTEKMELTVESKVQS